MAGNELAVNSYGRCPELMPPKLPRYVVADGSICQSGARRQRESRPQAPRLNIRRATRRTPSLRVRSTGAAAAGQHPLLGMTLGRPVALIARAGGQLSTTFRRHGEGRQPGHENGIRLGVPRRFPWGGMHAPFPTGCSADLALHPAPSEEADMAEGELDAQLPGRPHPAAPVAWAKAPPPTASERPRATRGAVFTGSSRSSAAASRAGGPLTRHRRGVGNANRRRRWPRRPKQPLSWPVAAVRHGAPAATDRPAERREVAVSSATGHWTPTCARTPRRGARGPAPHLVAWTCLVNATCLEGLGPHKKAGGMFPANLGKIGPK